MQKAQPSRAMQKAQLRRAARKARLKGWWSNGAIPVVTRIRTCVGCRTKATPSPGWRRCARDAQGCISIGEQAPGRGAWLCSPECFETAVRRGALARALRAELSTKD